MLAAVGHIIYTQKGKILMTEEEYQLLLSMDTSSKDPTQETYNSRILYFTDNTYDIYAQDFKYVFTFIHKAQLVNDGLIARLFVRGYIKETTRFDYSEYGTSAAIQATYSISDEGLIALEKWTNLPRKQTFLA